MITSTDDELRRENDKDLDEKIGRLVDLRMQKFSEIFADMDRRYADLVRRSLIDD